MPVKRGQPHVAMKERAPWSANSPNLIVLQSPLTDTVQPLELDSDAVFNGYAFLLPYDLEDLCSV